MAPITPFLTMQLLSTIEARRRRGERVFRFDLGEPQRPAHISVRAGVARTLIEEPQGYTESRGRPALRHAISRWYASEYDVAVDPDRIVITTGASAALTLAILAATQLGDAVASPCPGYPAYRNMTRALGRKPIGIQCGPKEQFRFAPSLLHGQDHNIRAAIFASPANPTGATLTSDELKHLLAYCRDADIRPISDEIYQGITFGSPPLTAAGDERAFVVNSFSKFWRLTGWRVGWLVCPADIVASVDALAQHFYLCPPAPSQTAALLALDQAEDCRSVLAVYFENREKVIATLKCLGISAIAPAEGAFYVYADFSHYTDDSLAFARRLLEETGVALAPGEDFDPVNGKTWMRFSTAGEPDVVTEGLAQLHNWLAAM